MSQGLLCNNPKFLIGYGEPAVPVDGMLMEIDEGWGFYVGPEFGCIHFRRKVT